MMIKVYDVFTEGPLSGNPTAVIYWEDGIDRMQMQGLARELNLPDSIFVFDISHSGTHIFNSLTFSPYEELSICAQAMIGAFDAIQKDLSFTKGEYTIGTAAGAKKLIWDEAMAYVSMGRPEVIAHDHLNNLKDTISAYINNTAIREMGVVNLSRKRLLIEVQKDQISQINMPASVVMDLCSRLRLNGITFFTQLNTNEVRSRHFTTSLNGGEDAVTGGASAAILAFINHNGTHQHKLTVHQGGFETRGGTMHTYVHENEIYVGGQCENTSLVQFNPYTKSFEHA